MTQPACKRPLCAGRPGHDRCNRRHVVVLVLSGDVVGRLPRSCAESSASGLNVVDFARRHDVHPNLVHAWRRQAKTGELSVAQDGEARFRPVAVATENIVAHPTRSGDDAGSVIEVVLRALATSAIIRPLGAGTRGSVGRCAGRLHTMIPMPAGTQIWVACGATDMSTTESFG